MKEEVLTKDEVMKEDVIKELSRLAMVTNDIIELLKSPEVFVDGFEGDAVTIEYKGLEMRLCLRNGNWILDGITV